MKLEVRSVSVGSFVASSVPIVVFLLSLIGGAVHFLVIPDPQLIPMTFSQKLISVALYSLLYTVILTALMVFLAFAYNICCSVLGLPGIAVDIEEMPQHE